MDDLFNSREIAVGLWLIALIAFAASKKLVREPLAGVLKSAFVPKIIIPLLLSFLPAALVVIVLAYLNLWDLSVLKETIYWVIGTGVVMFGRFSNVNSVKELYIRTAKDTLALIIILEFFVGFQVFPVWVELLLVPLTAFIVLLATVAKHTNVDGIELTRKVLNGLMAFIGLAIILFAVIAFVNNPKPLLTYQNLELFLLPIVLSFAYTPSVYLLALYSKYELVFNRIKYGLAHVKDKRAIKLSAFRRCGLSVFVTGEMIRHLAINLNNKTTKAQAIKLIRTFNPEHKASL